MKSEIQKQLNDIKNDLSLGLLERALGKFRGTSFENEAIGLLGKFRILENDKNKGILYSENYEVEHNRIVQRLQALIEKLELQLNSDDPEFIEKTFLEIEEEVSTLNESLDIGLGPVLNEIQEGRKVRFFERLAGIFLEGIRVDREDPDSFKEKEWVEVVIKNYPPWFISQQQEIVAFYSGFLDLAQFSLQDGRTADSEKFYNIFNEIEPVYYKFFKELFSTLRKEIEVVKEDKLPYEARNKLIEMILAFENAF